MDASPRVDTDRPGPRPPRRGRPRLLVPALGVGGSLVLLALLLAVVALAGGGRGGVRFDAPAGPVGYQRLRPGTPAAPIRLAGLDGGAVDLAALRGRPVVVNFWASWCEPCRRELPLLRRTLAEHSGERLAVVGVVVRDSPAAARQLARETGAGWPMGLDTAGQVAGAWRVANLPQTFFVRPDGTVASQQLGELHPQGLQEQLAAILR
ncbi:MAG TPA: TlpA disulfide reductase family protein [Actinomycetes bacterium]|nr:TlpA disulfide reductase family protein [Actinomycetes bacterium]